MQDFETQAAYRFDMFLSDLLVRKNAPKYALEGEITTVFRRIEPKRVWEA